MALTARVDGLPSDQAEDGRVKFSYPAFWANTSKGTWGYASMNTREFAGGAALLFPTDDYGPDVMEGLMPRPVTPGECNEMFDRVARQMKTVFGAARQLGIKTCIGTETPLIIPNLFARTSQATGMDFSRTNTVRALYTGIFKRIADAFPVDYYWLWTRRLDLGRYKPGQLENTICDIQTALGALNDLGRPFTLATSGWVLGRSQSRRPWTKFFPILPNELHQPAGRTRRR